MLESIILINASELSEISNRTYSNQRRSSLEGDDIQANIDQNPVPSLPGSLITAFEAEHKPPIETNQQLTQSLSEAFALEGSPSFLEFSTSIENLANLKNEGLDLPNKSFLSATKSMISAYLRSGGEFGPETNLAASLYNAILPKTASWGGGGVANWIKNLSQVSIEAFIDEGRNMIELSQLASSFARSTVELINKPTPLTDQLEINDLDIDYLKSDDSLTLEDRISLDKKYAPTKTQLLQQLSVGITQGYFGSLDYMGEEVGLSVDDFISFSQPNSSPSSINGGNIEENIISGFFDGLLIASTDLGDTKEVFLYDSVKASANGFLIASTVAATSKPEYLDQSLYLDSAEMIAKQVSQSVVLHYIDEPDGTKTYSMGKDWIDVNRVAESAASGSAMGSQLATVLPKSLDYSGSWEIATNIRRDIAKSVSRGSASGAVNAAAWLGSIIETETENETVLDGNEIESVSRGSSLGSMIGNTGLAIYYPTDQLVPIINLTAQGSAYGTTNATNLSLVESDSIETIDIGVARQSALGSSMGAIFEPTVLMGLNPAQNSNDKKTVDHLTAASFGATFGAILGLQDNEFEIVSRNGSSQFDESRVVEIQQATKQGAIEGALAGAKLSLGIDEVNSGSLKSKTVMLKAVNSANTKAAANSTSNVASQSLRTNPQDMLLLMRKFGINPRYTNPAKMYKRPVIVQTDEPPIDENASDAINNASPL